jgi:DNA-binding transcriptional LysR family regulator
MAAPSTLDWENLRTFLAVARAGSARAAAETLGVHYTSVTRRMAAFETSVGARLFDKSVHGYALTEHGQDILRDAEAMENAAFSVERKLTGADAQITGPLTVTMSTTIASFLLVDDLRDFRVAYPGINLSIDTGYRFADFGRREADVSVRVSNDPGDTLVGRRFGTFHQSVYARPDYIADNPPDKEGSGCCWLDWMHREAFEKKRAASEFPLVQDYTQIEDEVLLLGAAKSGWGMATLPCFYGDKQRDLVRVSKQPPEPVLGVWLLTHPDLLQSAKVRCFMDFFGKALSAKASELTGLGN